MQYRHHGLCHISDEAFYFYLALENVRVNYLTLQNAQNEKGKIVNNVLNVSESDDILQQKFRLSFPDTEQYLVSLCLKK